MNETELSPLAFNTSQTGNLGSWGQLEYVRIVIAPPLEFVGAMDDGTESRQWCFPGASRDAVGDLLTEAGLPRGQVDLLLATAQRDDTSGGLRLTVDDDLVRSLDAESRGRIYSGLGCWPINALQNNAFRFCGDASDQWFQDAGLQPATIDLARRYVYRHGTFLFFADLRVVMPQIDDRAERMRLLKALAGEVTWLMKLRVTPRSDVEELAAYWSHGRRFKDIRPILESLARCPGGEVLDVVHLLPPFARRLLYTYPHPPSGPQDKLKDCHWTSLNFFNELPDNRYLDLDHVVRAIERDYFRIFQDVSFGDLVILCSPQGEVFHSAIHIADDVTFTKQGPTTSRPWMFMKIEHLRDFYPRQEPIEVRFYRRREAV